MPLSRASHSASNNPVLTEHARRYRPEGFIAEKVMPPLDRPGAETGKVQVWDETNLEIPDDMNRAIGAPSSRANDQDLSYITYTTNRFSRHDIWTPREQRRCEHYDQDPEIFKASKLNKLLDQIHLKAEYDLATKLNTSANYETNYSTTLTTTFANSGGDPLGVITTGLDQCAAGGIYPNVAIMDYRVWLQLERHAALMEYSSKYVRAGRLDESAWKTIFGLDLLISKAIYASGGTKAAVWGDSIILAYINPNLMPVGESDMTLGRTIVEYPFDVKEWEDPSLDHEGATVFEVEYGYGYQFVGVDNATDGDTIAAYLIDNAI